MEEQTESSTGAASEKLWLEVVEELTPTDKDVEYSVTSAKYAKGRYEGGYQVNVDVSETPLLPFSEFKRRRAFTLFRDPVAMIGKIEGGIPVRVLTYAVSNGLIKQDEIRYVLPERTFRGRKKTNEPLTRDESDKFARMLQIMEFASETFGTTEKAHRWLRQPKRRFDGRTPMEMLDTSIGAQAVEDMLIQIAHGIAA